MKKYFIFLPNTIKILRMLLSAVFALVLVDWLSQGRKEVPYEMYLIYAFICLSDLIDGAAARLAFLYPGFRGWFHAMLYISVLLTALSFAKRSAHCLVS